MPELPEVETVRRGLNDLIVGQKIKKVKVHNPKSFIYNSDESQFLKSTIIAIRRRAKVLMIDLASEYSLVIHLKMTGQLIYRGEQNWGGGHPSDGLINDLPDKSTRVEFSLEKGKLYFNDQRKFGWVKLLPTVLITEIPFMQKVGPEPLTDDFDADYLANKLKNRQAKIKALLLDQTIVAGIGNIYADESLLLAKIHPARAGGDLKIAEIKLLVAKIKQVLQKSIDEGGSSSRNYVDAEGKKGNYLDWNYAYKRQGQICRVCQQADIVKIKLAGRGTHFCPHCQKSGKIKV